MQTEAVFEKIEERVQQEIGSAQKSIFIVVDSITSKLIFKELERCIKRNCVVSLIISNEIHNKKSSNDIDLLNIGNSRVFKVDSIKKEFRNDNFCVIDNSTIITGSYNWGGQSDYTIENAIISYNDTTLAEQFILKFKSYLKQFFPTESIGAVIFPLNKIIKRLEILKNFILLEDIEELKKETIKLEEYDFNSDLFEILKHIEKDEFSAAIQKIQYFISKNQQLSVWTDPEIVALKLEIKNLENQLNAFDNEKMELEKFLYEFQHRHSIELGEIILEILRLRKQKFRTDKIKYQEAENDEKQYNEQFKGEKERFVFELTEEEKKELKKRFRKATVLCHPDKVSDEFKEAAQKIFIELKAAYDSNDLKKVTEILNDLEKGNYFRAKSETVSEKDLLMAAIIKLRSQVKSLITEIYKIKESETFKTLITIENWDEYFMSTKVKLIKELEELNLQVKV